MFGALRGRDFRLFWSGAFASNIGSWIQSIALSWLVLQLTNSPLALGVVNFAGTAPVLALSLFGGDFADRADRRMLLIVTQTFLLILAVALAAITFAHLVTVGYVVGITLLTGIVAAANGPAWQAFIVDLVEPKDLPTAIALNSTQFNLSRVVGPSIAGVLLAVINAAGCFLINGLSFLAVVGALFFIRPHPVARRSEAGGMWKRLRVGLGYTLGHPVLTPLIALTSVVTICGFPYSILMPVMAQDVLGLGANGYGAMMAATGVGAILGSLTIARYGSTLPRGRLLIAAELGFSGAVIGFSLSRSFAVAAVLLICLGFCMIAYMTNANTAIQLIVPNELRGRVMSIWTLVSFGLMPIGSLVFGAIAQVWGAPLALGLGGAICGVAALATIAFSPTLRLLPAGVNLEIPPARAPRPVEET
ncbi:MAG: MFS transporter [Chloroflexota bacterium]